jgi:hypothetical protein
MIAVVQAQLHPPGDEAPAAMKSFFKSFEKTLTLDIGEDIAESAADEVGSLRSSTTKIRGGT